MQSRPQTDAPHETAPEIFQGVELRAKALWPRIAAELGVPSEGATFRLLKPNSRYADRRSLLKVTSQEGIDYVLRADFATGNMDFKRKLRARHRALADALRPVEGVSVPAILWEDPERDHVLMAFAPGETVFAELHYAELGFSNRFEVLRRVGRAIKELHCCSATGPRVFWPKAHLQTVKDKAQAVRSGALNVRKPHKFLGLCAMLHRAAQRAKGLSFAGALEHGDMHMRNLLITDEMISIIDFSNARASVPYRDVANIWQANGYVHLASGAHGVGFGKVYEADWAAFEEGYGMRVSQDPVFQFFYLERILARWMRLPAPDQPISDTTAGHLQTLVDLCEWLRKREPTASE